MFSGNPKCIATSFDFLTNKKYIRYSNAMYQYKKYKQHLYGSLKHVAELSAVAKEVWSHPVHHAPVLQQVILVIMMMMAMVIMMTLVMMVMMIMLVMLMIMITTMTVHHVPILCCSDNEDDDGEDGDDDDGHL